MPLSGQTGDIIITFSTCPSVRSFAVSRIKFVNAIEKSTDCDANWHNCSKDIKLTVILIGLLY